MVLLKILESKSAIRRATLFTNPRIDRVLESDLPRITIENELVVARADNVASSLRSGRF